VPVRSEQPACAADVTTFKLITQSDFEMEECDYGK
jgi:hypothetical protein